MIIPLDQNAMTGIYKHGESLRTSIIMISTE